MKLFFRKYGQGQPLIILHGLFGQSDNWNTLGKQFAEHFEVYLVDQRNHGLSPHSEKWNYKVMSEDLMELIEDNKLHDPILMGHSMGGKTAMEFALEHCGIAKKMVVVDIAPKKYPPHHDRVIAGLKSIEFSNQISRKAVEEKLMLHITDAETRQFLLKNLYWKDEKTLAWRFNLDVISDKINEVNRAIEEPSSPCLVPSLFVSGEKSQYISEEDKPYILKLFPNVQYSVIENSGHWVHAEQASLFFDEVLRFLKK